METALLGAILGLALIDSLNPASIASASYLRFVRTRSDVIAFAAAAYVTYLAFAFVLTDAVGPAARRVFDGTPSISVSILQIALGSVLVANGARAWSRRSRRAIPRSTSLGSASALGFLATMIDLPTAVPLIAASGIIVAAHPAQIVEVGVLVIYVIVCVAPLILIALIPQRFGSKTRPMPGDAGVPSAGLTPVLLAGLCIVLGAAAGGQGALALL
jgi:cytochrome c biogenesis protein CcdA